MFLKRGVKHTHERLILAGVGQEYRVRLCRFAHLSLPQREDPMLLAVADVDIVPTARKSQRGSSLISLGSIMNRQRARNNHPETGLWEMKRYIGTH